MERSDWRSLNTEIDFGTLWGAVAAFGLVFIAIMLGGGLASFLDLNSLLIVLGGTVGATLITFPLDDFLKTAAVLRTALFPQRSSALNRIDKLIEFAQTSRTSGELSLEHYTFSEPDPFLRDCLQLLVDGVKPEEIRRMLELEISSLDDRHRRGAQLFYTMGSVAPAMGLIGTLIGLVRMLENLNDPSQIGPAMALALLTTFYGAILAHIVFIPLAGKLRTRSEEEQWLKELTLEGVISIAEGVNPRLIEQRLQAFLPPELRFSRFG